MLALEAGGADIIELGVPFSDPVADGPVIQKANNVRSSSLVAYQLSVTNPSDQPQVAIENNVHYSDCLEYVRQARAQGLKAPVLFMGS